MPAKALGHQLINSGRLEFFHMSPVSVPSLSKRGQILKKKNQTYMLLSVSAVL